MNGVQIHTPKWHELWRLHAKWKQLDTNIVWVHLYKISRLDTKRETERLVVAGTGGRGGMGTGC